MTQNAPTSAVPRPADDALTIGEVAAATDLSVHALRYFERENLLLRDIPRTAGHRRVFTSQDVAWLLLVNRLRDSGMPLGQIRAFAALVRSGPGNERERLDLLEAHERAVRARIDELDECLDIIHAKVMTYSEHLAAGTARGLWSPSAAPASSPR